MGKNKTRDVVGGFLLCIAVASAVITASVADVSVDVKNCNGNNCELPNVQAGSVVVEVVVNGEGNGSTTRIPIGGGGPVAIEHSVKTLCQGSMYKDSCETVLVKFANGSGSTEEVIKSGATLALQGIENIFNLTATLQPKNSKKPEAAAMAVDDCKALLSDSMEKLKEAINQIGDPNAYKAECTSFTLRLWLSDVLTYTDNCMETLGGAEASDLQDVMKDGMANATQITMSVLDVFTGFTKAMGAAGFELNPDTIAEKIQGIIGGGEKGGDKGDANAAGTGRRLLGGGVTDMIGDDGLPRWLSAADRRLLNLDGERNERHLNGVPPNPPPNVVVAHDGSGQFKTILEALRAYDPKKVKLPPGAKYIIYIKAGVYDEYITVESKMKNIFMYGDGPTKTIVTGKKCYVPSLTGTMRTSSFSAQGAGFFAKDMGFENTAGPEGHQAVAFRSNGEQHVLLNCHFNGYQDTLYAQGGSQFFRDCTITGTVDFIFGNGATYFQKCNIIVRQPLPNQFNAVTAQGRTGPSMPTGIVIQDCTIVADPRLDKAKIKTYLGRPWKAFARTVFLENQIEDMITPEGYTPFDNTPNTQDSFWGEYMNKGPGSVTNARVAWPNVVRQLSREVAQTYTVGAFLPGADAWLKPMNVPYYAGFRPAGP